LPQEREALQLSCSDYLLIAPRRKEDRDKLYRGLLRGYSIGYVAPTYIVKVLNLARKEGLAMYEFLNGPCVPIYVTRERVGEAEAKLRESEQELAELGPPNNPDEEIGSREALRIYHWLLEQVKRCCFKELGFAYHIHSINGREVPTAVLIVNGETVIKGELPKKDEEYLSTSAITHYARKELREVIRWLKNELSMRCRRTRRDKGSRA